MSRWRPQRPAVEFRGTIVCPGSDTIVPDLAPHLTSLLRRPAKDKEALTCIETPWVLLSLENLRYTRRKHFYNRRLTNQGNIEEEPRMCGIVALFSRGEPISE